MALALRQRKARYRLRGGVLLVQPTCDLSVACCPDETIGNITPEAYECPAIGVTSLPQTLFLTIERTTSLFTTAGAPSLLVNVLGETTVEPMTGGTIVGPAPTVTEAQIEIQNIWADGSYELKYFGVYTITAGEFHAYILADSARVPGGTMTFSDYSIGAPPPTVTGPFEVPANTVALGSEAVPGYDTLGLSNVLTEGGTMTGTDMWLVPSFQPSTYCHVERLTGYAGLSSATTYYASNPAIQAATGVELIAGSAAAIGFGLYGQCVGGQVFTERIPFSVRYRHYRQAVFLVPTDPGDCTFGRLYLNCYYGLEISYDTNDAVATLACSPGVIPIARRVLNERLFLAEDQGALGTITAGLIWNGSGLYHAFTVSP